MDRRTVLKAGLATLGASALGIPSARAAWTPSRPVTIVVGYSPGGGTDIIARQLAASSQPFFPVPIVVLNKPGAAGTLAAQELVRTAPDGYTLMMGTVGTHGINEALYSKLPFSPLGDFQPISRVAMVPNLLVTHPSRPYKTVKELIEFAKANPGKVNFASSGSGTSIHLSGELFKAMTKVDMTHVPYKGSAPAVADLLGGQTDIMFDNMPSVMQHVKGGKLRAIAVTTDKRYPGLPEVPTIAESGVPGYNATSWFGLFTNRKVPPDVLAKLSAATTKVLAKPEVVQQMAEQGAIAHPEKPAEFEAFVKAETAKWGPVVKQSGARVD